MLEYTLLSSTALTSSSSGFIFSSCMESHIQYMYMLYMYPVHAVEPLNNGHIGMDRFVHYREVVLFQR